MKVIAAHGFVTWKKCESIRQHLADRLVELREDDDVKNANTDFDGRTCPFRHVTDVYVQAQMRAIRTRACELAEHAYGGVLWPEFTDLVRWVPGNELVEHDDNTHGYDEHRHVSSVLYLDDTFQGGLTELWDVERAVWFAPTRPRPGTLLMYESKVRHRVTLVEEGVRHTMPMWFTRHLDHRERLPWE